MHVVHSTQGDGRSTVVLKQPHFSNTTPHARIILRVEAKEVTPDDMIRTSEDVRNRFDERLQQVPAMVDGEHRLIRFNFGHQPNMQRT